MKKILLMAAMAAMMTVSCTNDNNETTTRHNDEIKFASPVMYNVSRNVGEITGVKYPDSETFMVYGIKYDASKPYPGWGEEGTEQEFAAEGTEMKARYDDNKQVEGWFPAFAHYYKEGMNYAFGAFSPANYNTGVTYKDKEGLQLTNYQPAAMGQQLDLMYAPRVYDKNATTDKTDGKYSGVNIAFKHALASVHFRVGVDPKYKRSMDKSGYKLVDGDFKIKSITLTDVKSKGNFNENIQNETAATNKNIYSAQPTWTVDGTTTNYTFLDNTEYIDIKVPTDAQTTVKQAVVDITTIPTGKYGILIPQDIENSGIKAVIEWQHRKWTDNDTFIIDDMKTEVLLEDHMKENKIWKQGVRYIYNVVFRGNLIYFAPTVEDWVEEEHTILPMPENNVIVP